MKRFLLYSALIIAAFVVLIWLCGCAAKGAGGAVALPQAPGLPLMPPVKRSFTKAPPKPHNPYSASVAWQLPAGYEYRMWDLQFSTNLHDWITSERDIRPEDHYVWPAGLIGFWRLKLSP